MLENVTQGKVEEVDLLIHDLQNCFSNSGGVKTYIDLAYAESFSFRCSSFCNLCCRLDCFLDIFLGNLLFCLSNLILSQYNTCDQVNSPFSPPPPPSLHTLLSHTIFSSQVTSSAKYVTYLQLGNLGSEICFLGCWNSCCIYLTFQRSNFLKDRKITTNITWISIWKLRQQLIHTALP